MKIRNNMENNNIFGGAKFRDKFLCRNGEIAIYQDSYDMSLMFGSDKPNIHHRLFTKNYILDTNDTGILGLDDEGIQELIDLGNEITPKDRGEYDIVSRYQEPIDEEKLDRFAKEYVLQFNSIEETTFCERDFKAGYYKAMEENV